MKLINITLTPQEIRDHAAFLRGVEIKMSFKLDDDIDDDIDDDYDAHCNSERVRE